MPMNVDVPMRLDRLLCLLALGSRSQVRNIVKGGRIAVNGQTEKNADRRLNPGDSVALNGQTLDARTVRHVMLYKPCGVLTAAMDKKQKTVLDLLPPLYKACGCMPVGRLDKDTEGLLLLSTDGEMAHRLLSPKRHVEKCYRAEVDGPLNPADIAAFAQGLTLSDFTAQPARLEILSSCAEKAVALVWVHEGKYHQVRRMFAARGRTVTALKRLSIGPLALDESLQPGEYRELEPREVEMLLSAVSGEENP